MRIEDELVGLRRRLAQLQQSLLGIDDRSAIALVKLVIEDIEARIAAVAATRAEAGGMAGTPTNQGGVRPAGIPASQPQQPALQQQQPQPDDDDENA